ncbi:hypothetical protein RM572_11980 [Streptomyces sp. DSM 42041]|uniref:Uncharacterized protein n=1 Tax=Streptomyces hazeniae TaxID=3075538 RepID=A0ABU2NR72_9ACTN|nr:hypothetical protein [Streptomyces sp. DSM 42041]MDT0379484.1 hypothetical protein [Streptomyces sp. DSM 42041]
MQLSRLASLYTPEQASFATVYLEGRSPGEDAADQVRLRWHELRERLTKEGASEAALGSVDEALSQDKAGEEQADGRVLVASAEGRLALDQPWDAALGAGDQAHWGPFPELGSYVRHTADAVRVLLVVADQQEARFSAVTVATGGDAAEDSAPPQEGGSAPHRRVRHRSATVVNQDADDFDTTATDALRRTSPDLVVLAGEVQGRATLRSRMPDPLSAPLVETDRGGVTDSRARHVLDEELLQIATRHAQQKQRDDASRFHEAEGHRNTVQGSDKVLEAAESGALDMLFTEAGTAAGQEARILGAAARSGAGFALVPHGTGLAGGVAGILRFSPGG